MAGLKAVRHSIKSASRLTGLGIPLIRMWEQRHQAVKPKRTAGGQRVFSAADIERLQLLRQATQSGHTISLVATLPTAQLRELAGIGGQAQQAAHPPSTEELARELVKQGQVAVAALDEAALSGVLKRGWLSLGTLALLEQVVSPLAQSLGELWIAGCLSSANEHFATAVLRQFLASMPRAYGGSESAPLLVVATPAGQLHELGALLVRGVALNLGWQVLYLGASLPAAEIAGCVRQKGARAVALSLVHPADDAGLPAELARLGELLPAECELLAGGAAMPAYRETLDRLGAVMMDDLTGLIAALNHLRNPGGRIHASGPEKIRGAGLNGPVSNKLNGMLIS